MKCDKLQRHSVRGATYNGEEICGGFAYYDADEVDEAIAELKARIQLDDDEMAGFLDLEEECGGGDLRNYIAELKQKLSEKDKEIESLKASHYAEMVDAGMRERRLRRALYKACANWAHEKDDRYYLKYVCISDDARIQYERWRKMESKCRAKAEEFR